MGEVGQAFFYQAGQKRREHENVGYYPAEEDLCHLILTLYYGCIMAFMFIYFIEIKKYYQKNLIWGERNTSQQQGWLKTRWTRLKTRWKRWARLTRFKNVIMQQCSAGSALECPGYCKVEWKGLELTFLVRGIGVSEKLVIGFGFVFPYDLKSK